MEYYPDQFTPADITQARELVDYCLQYGLVIDFEAIDSPRLITDLLIVKCMEIAKYASE